MKPGGKYPSQVKVQVLCPHNHMAQVEDHQDGLEEDNHGVALSGVVDHHLHQVNGTGAILNKCINRLLRTIRVDGRVLLKHLHDDRGHLQK